MKVLWITNILFPEAKSLLSGKSELCSSGGWLLGASEALLKNDSISLAVATVTDLVDRFSCLKGKQISYYLLPLGKGNKKKNNEYGKYWQQVNDEFKPDVVHIYGTEFTHGLAWVDACGAKNVVVSIQGLLTGIAPLCRQGITTWDLLKNLTVYEFYKRDTIFATRHIRKRSLREQEILTKVNHVIGRTNWDRAHVLAINPNVEYHHCDETLRVEFYDGEWQYDKCVKHSIFLSQVYQPLKGFHVFLRALPRLLKQYPDITVRIAGVDITQRNTLRERVTASAYSEYIKKEIINNGLASRIKFLGSLNATQMKREYLNCNVFVCPSSIENSPNSLCEAQILGTPIVASYAGGIPDLMVGDEQALYRFEDEILLAQKISDIFMSKPDKTSMIASAQKRHDAQNNAQVLTDIYRVISSQQRNY